jgi:hypothetical protein
MTNIELANLEQGSIEWKQARAGIFTASRAADGTAAKKQTKAQIAQGIFEETAERSKYRTELICEILTGQPYPHFVSQDMMWGSANEPFARAAYELQQDVLVETCGLIMHPDIPRFGASCDGLIGKDGILEVKCPTTRTHLEWLMAGVVPTEHVPQMLAQMACTGRQWVDFVSFDPRLPAHLQLFGRRFRRDEKLIDTLENEVVHFTKELDEVLAALPQGPAQPIATLLEMPRVDELEF